MLTITGVPASACPLKKRSSFVKNMPFGYASGLTENLCIKGVRELRTIVSSASNNSSYGPGFLRAKQNGISSLDVYKNSQFEKKVSSINLNLSVGQRVFHQKFGMGFIISSDGDKLNINFDKAGEKKVVSSFVKIIE